MLRPTLLWDYPRWNALVKQYLDDSLEVYTATEISGNSALPVPMLPRGWEVRLSFLKWLTASPFMEHFLYYKCDFTKHAGKQGRSQTLQATIYLLAQLQCPDHHPLAMSFLSPCLSSQSSGSQALAISKHTATLASLGDPEDASFKGVAAFFFF